MRNSTEDSTLETLELGREFPDVSIHQLPYLSPVGKPLVAFLFEGRRVAQMPWYSLDPPKQAVADGIYVQPFLSGRGERMLVSVVAGRKVEEAIVPPDEGGDRGAWDRLWPKYREALARWGHPGHREAT